MTTEKTRQNGLTADPHSSPGEPPQGADPRWQGPSERTRPTPTDYFIPCTLQTGFGKVAPLLKPFLTAERAAKIGAVARSRSRRVACVFESTTHCHNVSAVLRTIDAFGFQDVFFVYDFAGQRFRLKDSVERGASQWLSPRRAPSIEDCAAALRASGYLILLVSLPTFYRSAAFYEKSLPSFAVSGTSSDLAGFLATQPHPAKRRIALVFGNELAGISERWLRAADGYIHVPMFGFVESLNLSVCAGVILGGLRATLGGANDADETAPGMSQAESALLEEHWFARTCPRARDIISTQSRELVDYFDFVAAGRFYSPFG